jgi:hypothetical protein
MLKRLALCSLVSLSAQVSAQKPMPPDCQPVKRQQGPVYGKLGLFAAIAQSASDNADVRACQKSVESRLSAESLAVVRRIEAQWNLFVPRARMVMQRAADSVGVQDSTRTRFWGEAANALESVWTLDHEASAEKMTAAIEPVATDYARRLAAFGQRSVLVYTRLTDSLGILRNDALATALNARLVPLQGQNIDATEADIRHSMQPVVDSVGRTRKRP